MSQDLLLSMIAEQVGVVTTLLKSRNLKMGTAESCTGGMIATAMTTPAGSSSVFDGGIVSYSNEVKKGLLWVPASILETYGAVSRECAEAMAAGAARALAVHVAVAVTGIAGPGGATPSKPVGLVWMAVCLYGETTSQMICWPGEREEVRMMTTLAALKMVAGILRSVERETPRAAS